MARNGYKKINDDADTENISLVSFLFMQWMNNVFKTGNERALTKDDFLPLSENDTTAFVTEQLQLKWDREVKDYKVNGKKPKLWKSVARMFSVKDLMFLISTVLVNSCCRILEPLLLGYFMTSLFSDESHRIYLLYGCALSMFINSLIRSLSANHNAFRSELVGNRMSSALKGLVYRKTLLLRRDVLLKLTAGHVIDLVTNDVQRFEDELVMWFFFGVAAVFDTFVIAILLVCFIGWQCLMGVIFVCFLVPYFAGLSYIGAVLRVHTAKASDMRLSLMNQVIAGIRAIKIHAWEDQHRERIKHLRRQEVDIVRNKSAILSGIAALEYTSTSLATLVSVITLVLTGPPLTPVNVFMLISFTSALRMSISSHLAYALQQTFDAYASLTRIAEFLLLEDADSSSDTDTSALNHPDHGVVNQHLHVANEVKCPEPATGLRVTGLNKTQNKREDEFILQDIEFTAQSGGLTVITGPVGSGKSTLLSAIAGEASISSGEICCKGTVVYVPQTAWVFSGTIRENILFGEPYDQTKYTKTIEACALTEDMQQFPSCDETIVGERGVILSGGQRARVTLARAVYADADIYLLDDALSAVDFKVGQHIFEKCIKGLLSHKTLVLTSHQERHMQESSQVIMLYKGYVLGKGSLAELKETGILNTTVDPLYKKFQRNDADSSTDQENEEVSRVSDSCGRIVPQTSEDKCFQISEEDRVIGKVSSKLYWNYIRSGASSLIVIALILFCFITQAFIVSPDVLLSYLTKKHPDEQRKKMNLIIYGCLVGGAFTFAIFRAYGLFAVSLQCSERLHDKMVVAILQAPVLFFDSNPVGRIMNRFSKDVGCLDEVLPKTFLMAIQMILLSLTGILVPVVTNPWLLIVVVPLAVLAVFISRYYLNTSRELKRLESISCSPVHSHISETLDGLDTIRTRGRERDFVDQFHRFQDVRNQSLIMVQASGRWLSLRMDLLAAFFIGAVALAAVLMAQDAAFAGLALVYAIKTMILTPFAVRKTSDVENLMTSVERVMTYTKIDSEPGHKDERRPAENWPHEGNITFQDVSLTYYPGGPQVLKNVNLSIQAGEKIGIAGRTGAGKSSFVAALMRMPDPDGQIILDGVQIKKLNLRKARRCISFLGQNPVLFSGSLRKNLDVMEQFRDADLWRALEDVQLKDLVESLEGHLDHELLENGSNVSVGERQLICLARVLLQQNKITILDEPTAHVDPDTEQTIWSVVREKLRDSTVIIIAHRLNTIRDCDKILVLNNGQVVEFDSLETLVNTKGSALSQMARIASF